MHKSVNVSVKFHFTVDRVEGLPPSQSVYSLAWSISKGIGRVWNGGSRKVVLTGGTATFNETFEVTGTMHQIKGGKFESKPMKVSLQEEATKGKKIQAKAAAKLVLELADVAMLTKEPEARSYAFTGTKHKTAPTLHIRVRAEWLKYDGKVVATGAQGAIKGDGTKREAVEVGGKQVYLMTDQEISDEDDASKDEDPFTKDDADDSSASSPAKSGAGAYEGNPLFRKMGGEYENPNRPVSSTQALIEQSKAPPNALFKMTDGTIKGPGDANPNSSARLLEEARAVTQQQQQPPPQSPRTTAANNPFGAPPQGVLGASDAQKAPSGSVTAKTSVTSSSPSSSNPFLATPAATPPAASTATLGAVTAQEPSTPSQRGTSSPASAAASSSPLSPSSGELELLRKQNKSLKELLERQDEKIEQLRVKVRTGSGAPAKKGALAVDPLQRGESFVREKERALEDVSTRLVDAEKLVASTRVQLTAEKQQVASMEAALVAEKKRGDELAAALALERKRLHDAEAASKRALEHEAEVGRARRRIEELEAAVALEKKRNQDMFSKLAEANSTKGAKSAAAPVDTSARVAELEAALALERSKKPVAPPVPTGTVDSALLEAERKRSAELAKQLEQSQQQLSSVNRELSGKQLTMIELTNRLRDAEEKQQSADRLRRTANGAAAPHPLEGEINSLRMQIVAMEQDYEGQLEDLRSQLEELQGGGGDKNKSADEGNSSTLERSSSILHDEPRHASRSGSAKTERPHSGSGLKSVPLEEFEEMQERHRKRIEQLESKLAVAQRLQSDSAPSPLAPGKNPLMSVVPAASPGPSPDEESMRAELAVMRGVEEGVWSAPMEYDGEGVAVAARLIMGVVTDNPKARYSAKLHKAVANAIAKTASNQSSLDGKCYWLNAVVQLLHVLSSTPEYGVRSPMEAGIDVEARKLTTSQAAPTAMATSALGDFPVRIHELSLSIYQMILDDLRDLVVNEALVRAIFDPALTSRTSLGAKHNAANARSPDSIAAELDAALQSCVKARLFPAVVRQLFAQLFYDMNAVLFNTLLKRTELCSASRAIEIKLGVSHFDNWPASASVPPGLRDVLRGVSARGFAPLKESCNLFFLDKSDAAMIRETCPSLNPRQIKSLLSAFVPDDIAPDKPALSVLDALGDQVRKTDTLKMDEKILFSYARSLL